MGPTSIYVGSQGSLLVNMSGGLQRADLKMSYTIESQ